MVDTWIDENEKKWIERRKEEMKVALAPCTGVRVYVHVGRGDGAVLIAGGGTKSQSQG